MIMAAGETMAAVATIITAGRRHHGQLPPPPPPPPPRSGRRGGLAVRGRLALLLPLVHLLRLAVAQAVPVVPAVPLLLLPERRVWRQQGGDCIISISDQAQRLHTAEQQCLPHATR
jgi:hypothetical protein